MKVAVLSDIHSNQVALEAVMEHMDSPDEIVFCGDVVGYAARPEQCLSLLRESTDVIVQGNHDRNVPNPQRYRANNMAYEGLKHSQRELDDEDIEWLSNLPKTLEFEDYLVAHSHPKNTGKYVYPREFRSVAGYARENDYEGIILGHTHVQHTESFGDCFVLNPGSVGQPRDKNPDAAYAVIDTEDNSIDLRRVDYDIQEAQRRIKEAGLPTRTAERLSIGE